MSHIDIITDGACSGNPGRGGWAAIVVNGSHVSEFGGRVDATTNNRMELHAAIVGLQQAGTAEHITVYTDSQYLINGITRWINGWQKNGWRTRNDTAVENQDLWQQLATLNGPHVSWQHVKGHSGHTLNERANTIAQQHAGSQARSSDAAPAAAGYPVYLSLVAGQLQYHRTWPACQAVVNGVSGAKFKKARSAQEVAAILAQWGVKGS